jgi:hemolysin D
VIVKARGRLVTQQATLVVQPLETSIIRSIDVRSGQVVKRGATLATLDGTFTDADESQLQSRLASLNTQLESLEAELNGRLSFGSADADDTQDSQIQAQLAAERRATYQSQMRRQNESIAGLQSALETARKDEEALVNRVKVLREMATMSEDLVDKKLAVKSRLLESQDRLLEAQRSMELARNRQLELRREIAAVQAERSSFETGWRQRLLEEQLAISRERDAINDQLEKTSLRQRMVVLTAPADAVVLEVAPLSAGSIVREAEPFFKLVPLNARLEAQVQIDTKDVGYIKTGDRTLIKVDAFPFQKHGMLTGQLLNISQDTLRRQGGGEPGGLETFYQGKVSLGESQLEKLPEGSTLLPGMTLSAEIHVGKRTVMSYLLWPMTRAFSESIREP